MMPLIRRPWHRSFRLLAGWQRLSVSHFSSFLVARRDVCHVPGLNNARAISHRCIEVPRRLAGGFTVKLCYTHIV